MKTRILLFAHGARDPRWSAPLERLAEVVRSGDASVEVGLAFLEFMSPTLPEAIAQAVGQGVAHIRVVPVFLAAGGHVKRDLPRMLEEAKALHPGLVVELAPVLGEDEGVIAAMAAAILIGA
jgi:sirohydrochlorin cobaltochelatase